MLLLLPALLFVFLATAITFAGHAVLVRPGAGLRQLSEQPAPDVAARRANPLSSFSTVLEKLGTLARLRPRKSPSHERN